MARPTSPTGGRRVELYVRSGAPFVVRDRVRDVAERLRSLRPETIDAVERRRWPATVAADERSPDGDVGPVVEAFRSWADRAGVDPAPALSVGRVRTRADGGVREETALPVVGMLVREDGDVLGAYPHVTDDGIRTVSDGVDRLAAEGQSVDGADDRPFGIAD